MSQPTCQLVRKLKGHIVAIFLHLQYLPGVWILLVASSRLV